MIFLVRLIFKKGSQCTFVFPIKFEQKAYNFLLLNGKHYLAFENKEKNCFLQCIGNLFNLRSMIITITTIKNKLMIINT